MQDQADAYRGDGKDVEKRIKALWEGRRYL